METLMEEFLKGLFALLVGFEVLNKTANQYAPLIFCTGCAVIGILTVMADLAFFLIRGESMLMLRHSFRTTSVFFVAWAFGAAIVGYVGQMLNIFQVSLLACATVGVSWPIVFTKLLKKLREEEYDTQKVTEEE
jgi:hypothetical protein